MQRFMLLNGGGSRVAEVERRRPGVSPPHSHGAQARAEHLDRLCSGKTQKDPCSFQGIEVYYFQSLNRKLISQISEDLIIVLIQNYACKYNFSKGS